ncbi:hypothetical protein JCM6882_001864 [Rhodosporidiobolus microsporus]
MTGANKRRLDSGNHGHKEQRQERHHAEGLEGRIGSLEVTIGEKSRLLAASRVTEEELRREILTLKKERAGMEKKIARFDGILDKVKEESSAIVDKVKEDAEAQCTAAAKTLADYKQQYLRDVEARERFDSTERQLTVASEALGNLSNKLDATTAALEETSSQLDAANLELERLRPQLAAADDKSAMLKQELVAEHEKNVALVQKIQQLLGQPRSASKKDDVELVERKPVAFDTGVEEDDCNDPPLVAPSPASTAPIAAEGGPPVQKAQSTISTQCRNSPDGCAAQAEAGHREKVENEQRTAQAGESAALGGASSEVAKQQENEAEALEEILKKVLQGRIKEMEAEMLEAQKMHADTVARTAFYKNAVEAAEREREKSPKKEVDDLANAPEVATEGTTTTGVKGEEDEEDVRRVEAVAPAKVEKQGRELALAETVQTHQAPIPIPTSTAVSLPPLQPTSSPLSPHLQFIIGGMTQNLNALNAQVQAGQYDMAQQMRKAQEEHVNLLLQLVGISHPQPSPHR